MKVWENWIELKYLYAAAAKSLQLCPTLCDPIDGSPLGSSIHGIFQARVLEWGAIASPSIYIVPQKKDKFSYISTWLAHWPPSCLLKSQRGSRGRGRTYTYGRYGTHASALAWRLPWTEEPGGLQSMGSQSRTRLKRLSSSSSMLIYGRN